MEILVFDHCKDLCRNFYLSKFFPNKITSDLQLSTFERDEEDIVLAAAKLWTVHFYWKFSKEIPQLKFNKS